jgi:hypothetical protein
MAQTQADEHGGDIAFHGLGSERARGLGSVDAGLERATDLVPCIHADRLRA